ncbi:MAG: hypothetical protein P4M00_13100 [Azospirillaceae bacterium]|nr:hypothetical protein [Azospirillaceae bacterium]
MNSYHFECIKFNLVKELFINTADENYISFRVCLINRIDNEMLWQAVHAIEKYIKAVLLLNDIPVRGMSHKIVLLYEKLSTIGGDLLPQTLAFRNLETSMTPEKFIESSYPAKAGAATIAGIRGFRIAPLSIAPATI